MSDEVVVIKINNWEKYQHHNGKKTYDWFKLSSNLFDDHEIMSLSYQEFKVWIYLLCSTAKVRKSEIKVSAKRTASDCKVYAKYVQSAVNRLESFGILTVISGTLGVPQKRRKEKRVEEKRRDTLQITKKQKRPAQSKWTGAPVWDSFKNAYLDKYKVEPVRNAMVNKQLSLLVTRVGLENAVELMPFYLSHRDSFYLLKGHPVGLCLKDCESLVAQMKSGNLITKASIKNQENNDHYAEQLKRIRTKHEQE